MFENLNWEYEVLKHYHRYGIFARRGLVSVFLAEINKNIKKEKRSTQKQDFGLNDNEVISVLQVGAVAHIMMFLEDLAVICKAIQIGKVDYYSYLDRSGEEDLGKIVGEFYNNIIKSNDDELRKILSYIEIDKFAFETNSDRQLVNSVIKQNIEKTKKFFTEVDIFRHNHIRIFRRYKHAGLPIIFGLEIPPGEVFYKNYEFMSIAFTSKEVLTNEVATLPFSTKVLESYTTLLNDIFEFLGLVILNKLVCIERKLDAGFLPNHMDMFGMKLLESKRHQLEKILNKFEEKYPLPKGETHLNAKINAEYMEWYENIDKHSKSSF